MLWSILYTTFNICLSAVKIGFCVLIQYIQVLVQEMNFVEIFWKYILNCQPVSEECSLTKPFFLQGYPSSPIPWLMIVYWLVEVYPSPYSSNKGKVHIFVLHDIIVLCEFPLHNMISLFPRVVLVRWGTIFIVVILKEYIGAWHAWIETGPMPWLLYIYSFVSQIICFLKPNW